MSLPPQNETDPELVRAVSEIESYAARAWDRPPALFALVRAEALATTSEALPADIAGTVAADPHHLIGVEQEGFATDGADLEAALATIAWPPAVAGVALAVERIMVPPAAESALPTAPEDLLTALATHPERQDVRIVVGVLRSGDRWCAVRTRAHDSADAVALGPDLVPGLTDALSATLET